MGKSTRLLIYSDKKSLLIPDTTKSHFGEVVDYFKRYNTEYEIIAEGINILIQLIDTHVHKPFKYLMRAMW